MSDLQIAMIVLGVALVVAVWFYNLWLERKQRERTAQGLPQAATDTEPAGEPGPPREKTEPSLDAPPPATAHAVPPEPSYMDADLPLEPEAQTPAESGEVDLLLDVEEEPPATIPVPEEWSDGRADCLLSMRFPAAVPARALWEEHHHWSDRIDKPVQWLDLEEGGQHWHTLLPQDTGRVSQLAVALQLVDRLGAVSEVTLAAFADGITRLAQRFQGRIDPPDVAALLVRARELDAFCASVDLQLSLHVLPAQAPTMAGARLKPLLDEAGLRLEGERYLAFAPDGAEAFALICRSATSFPAERVAAMDLIDLIFSLDVPRVAAGTATFDRMLAFAHQCAAALDGQLADAHRKPLGDATVAVIRGRIDELQQRMTERGIPPGSVRALRLFADA